jgi:hypothetical protein
MEYGCSMNYDYVKNPVVVQAFQMTEARGEDNSEWPEWLHSAWNKEHTEEGALYRSFTPRDRTLYIHTLEGVHRVSWDDYIIRGISGEIYPCKPDIFLRSYSPI